MSHYIKSIFVVAVHTFGFFFNNVDVIDSQAFEPAQAWRTMGSCRCCTSMCESVGKRRALRMLSNPENTTSEENMICKLAQLLR